MKCGWSLVICFERGAQVGPVLLHLVVVGLVPEDIGGDAAHAERGQLDRLAGRVDLAELRLAEVVLAAELGQHAAGPALRARRVAGGRMAQPEQRHQQHADRHQVDDLAERGCSLRVHRATSRVLRKK